MAALTQALLAASSSSASTSTSTYIDDVFYTGLRTGSSFPEVNYLPFSVDPTFDSDWNSVVGLFRFNGNTKNEKTGLVGTDVGCYYGYAATRTKFHKCFDQISGTGTTHLESTITATPNFNQPWCIEGWFFVQSNLAGTSFSFSNITLGNSSDRIVIDIQANSDGTNKYETIRIIMVVNNTNYTAQYTYNGIPGLSFLKFSSDGSTVQIIKSGAIVGSVAYPAFSTQPNLQGQSIVTLYSSSLTASISELRITCGTNRGGIVSDPTEPFKSSGTASAEALIWTKCRGGGGAYSHSLSDTIRGVPSSLATDTTAIVDISSGILNVMSDSFVTNTAAIINGSSNTYVDWVFKRASKFFDIVTWTGNGANRTIAHNLGIAPGMIMVKRTDTTGSWMVYHNGIANTENLVMNTTAAKVTNASAWNSTIATSSVFSLGTHADVNTNGGTYIAYVFAHDNSANGLIQCGVVTTDGSGSASITLGWEPQFILERKVSGTDNWRMLDTARGLLTKSGVGVGLSANLTAAEVNLSVWSINATGIDITGDAASSTFVYMAIRRSNKPPTSGTQVYNTLARSGTGTTTDITGVGFAPDLVITKSRNFTVTGSLQNRLIGKNYTLQSANTTVEAYSPSAITSFNIDGYTLGTDTSDTVNTSGRTYIDWVFKRAIGVCDIVAYRGTGTATTQAHSLGVVPELIIVKDRSQAYSWAVYNKDIGNTYFLYISSASGKSNATSLWNNTTPTSSVFSISNASNVNLDKHIAYLFATKAGISKVGTYTGNGTSQTINCGFAAGARFILIKRTDNTGDWYVWDTVRGIVATNDPHLSLNTTAFDVSSDDSVDPDASGFIVNQLAATNINVTSATYIFLAMA